MPKSDPFLWTTSVRMSLPKQNGHGGSVDLHIDGQIAVVTIRRGENRINQELVQGLLKALDEVERDSNVRVLITTGEGKFYCNGVDLHWMKAAAAVDVDGFNAKFGHEATSLYNRLLTFPVPTIAAVNGHVFAGGVILALHHDYIVMQSGRGWLCLNEVFINLRFAAYARALIRAKLTATQINGSVILGHRYTAQEAKQAGIIADVAPPGKLLEVVKNFASRFLSMPAPYNRESMLNMKRDIYASVLNTKNNPTDGIVSNL